jgi:hypothetical protein
MTVPKFNFSFKSGVSSVVASNWPSLPPLHNERDDKRVLSIDEMIRNIRKPK